MPKEIKIPKSPALCADKLYLTRKERLVIQKDVDALQALETAIKNYFIDNLSKSDATGIAGKVARVQINPSTIPIVEDWGAFGRYIKKTGQIGLLQRRLNEEAIKELWADGVEVPGVTKFNLKKVSCTALKGGK